MTKKEEIIISMCYTYRHDYGLSKVDDFSSGVTPNEKHFTYNLMSQIFENDIEPHMIFKERSDVNSEANSKK